MRGRRGQRTIWPRWPLAAPTPPARLLPAPLRRRQTEARGADRLHAQAARALQCPLQAADFLGRPHRCAHVTLGAQHRCYRLRTNLSVTVLDFVQLGSRWSTLSAIVGRRSASDADSSRATNVRRWSVENVTYGKSPTRLMSRAAHHLLDDPNEVAEAGACGKALGYIAVTSRARRPRCKPNGLWVQLAWYRLTDGTLEPQSRSWIADGVGVLIVVRADGREAFRAEC